MERKRTGFFARLRARIALAFAALAAMTSTASSEAVMLEVEEARASLDEATGRPVLLIRLAPSGQKAFTDFTMRYEGAAIDMLIDDDILSSPVIQTPIYSNALTISGDFSAQQVEDLAMRLGSESTKITVRMQDF